jgi:uncharacterized protein YqjF (DUF2071 family)
MLTVPGEPLLISDWDRALMIHYEVDAEALQRIVPFELDLRDGRAFVSLVAFTMRGMRFFRGGALTAWLLKPIATHNFLNVRIYVRRGREDGIYFLAEWLNNKLSVMLGPGVFGLPYRLGRLDYEHDWNTRISHGRVEDRKGIFEYHAVSEKISEPRESEPGSLTEWLMERYTAFTQTGSRARFFRVWHQPWRQDAMEVTIGHQSLLERNWALFRNTRPIGANFSPGLNGVWMGRPHLAQST